MKIRTFIVVIFSVFAFGSNAQVQFGVKGGVSFYGFKGKLYGGTPKLKPGIYTGGFVKIPITKDFNIQPELIYSMQGRVEDYNDFADFFESANVCLNYINVPLMAQYFLEDGFFVETGPQLGINISAGFKLKGGSRRDIKEDIKTPDLAWAFGTGYQLPSGLSFSARFNHSLTNISKQGEIRNRGVQLGVSFLFKRSNGDKKRE